MKNKTKAMVMTSIFTAFITIGGFVKIPLPHFEYITLRLLFVVLAGFVLGAKWGAIASAMHMILGLAGFPIFASGGGISYIMKPSFGYILGFVAAGFVSGWMYRRFGKCTFKTSFISSIAGMISMYIIGLTYKFIILKAMSGLEMSIYIILFSSLPMELPGDIILCMAASFANVKINRLIVSHPEIKID